MPFLFYFCKDIRNCFPIIYNYTNVRVCYAAYVAMVQRIKTYVAAFSFFFLLNNDILFLNIDFIDFVLKLFLFLVLFFIL